MGEGRTGGVRGEDEGVRGEEEGVRGDRPLDKPYQ